MFLYLV